jgi:putative membrane protein
MVLYNPKEWWKLIFAFHKSDTFRRMLPAMLAVAGLTLVVAYLENSLFHASFRNSTAVHSVVGFALSLLLVFRTNSAYERWWEGRKLWGSFVNNSRNLALKLSTLLEDPATLETFRVLIGNYVLAARDHLRGKADPALLTETQGYTHSWYSTTHVPNRIMQALYRETWALTESGAIPRDTLLLLNAELQSFTDNLGACERIRKTPIPFSYHLFLKKLIFLYTLSMPLGFVREFGYWAAPIVALVFYVFSSIELIAEEIEDPFGTDANDLPTDSIVESIHLNLAEILSHPVPRNSDRH